MHFKEFFYDLLKNIQLLFSLYHTELCNIKDYIQKKTRLQIFTPLFFENKKPTYLHVPIQDL